MYVYLSKLESLGFHNVPRLFRRSSENKKMTKNLYPVCLENATVDSKKEKTCLKQGRS